MSHHLSTKTPFYPNAHKSQSFRTSWTGSNATAAAAPRIRVLGRGWPSAGGTARASRPKWVTTERIHIRPKGRRTDSYQHKRHRLILSTHSRSSVHSPGQAFEKGQECSCWCPCFSWARRCRVAETWVFCKRGFEWPTIACTMQQ